MLHRMKPPGDTTLIVTINYENFSRGCWGRPGNDAGKTNRTECLDCTPNGTFLSRKYGSEQITIKWDSLDVTISPSEIFAGDTAQVIIKKRLPDGTLVDFDTTQTYEVGMLDGCILGKIHADGVDTNYIYGVTQPIYFIADTSVTDSGDVLLRVGIIEQTKTNKNNNQTEQMESYCHYGSFLSSSYDDARASVENPLKIIYPTPTTINEISAIPQMPAINCSAVFMKSYSEAIKFEWKFIVLKHYSRRTSGYVSVCERISRSEFQGLSYADFGNIFTIWTVPFDVDSGFFYFKAVQPSQDPNFPKEYYGCEGETDEWYDETSNEIFTGGNVFITLTAKNNQTGEILAKLIEIPSGKILGTNPDDPSTIYAYANSNKIKAILQIESKENQFTGIGINQIFWWPYNEAG